MQKILEDTVSRGGCTLESWGEGEALEHPDGWVAHNNTEILVEFFRIQPGYWDFLELPG